MRLILRVPSRSSGGGWRGTAAAAAVMAVASVEIWRTPPRVLGGRGEDMGVAVEIRVQL